MVKKKECKNDQTKTVTIAKRLKQAQENAALLTTFNEVDMH